jgi:BirA family transcriptional regulator, biotin operon repressor / biotin---[acetyl-CoA-carboxylase] ligase
LGAGEEPRWEGLTAEELRHAWELPAVHYFHSVHSTSDVARELGAAGAVAGTAVLAEEQTAGRGRSGRRWSSSPGVGLWLSLVARPGPEADLATLPLHVGVAIARAIDPWAEHEPVLVKWPNDLLIGGLKMGGILCEGAWSGARLDHVVVGIGLNLLQDPDEFPAELRGSATSLRSSATRSIARFDVATAVVEAVRPLLSAPVLDPAAALGLLEERDALRDRFVEIVEPESGKVLLRGVAAGFGADGALLVRGPNGTMPVRTGTVRKVDR